MLHITIDPDARRYLSQYSNTVTLRASPRHGCCGGRVLLPIAEPGVTQGSEAWPIIERNGIRIHMDPGIEILDHTQLRIGVDRLLMMSRLWVEGLSATM